MGWLERLRPASIGGIPFQVESDRGTFGRKTVEHEYPERDIPESEDLGRKGRTYQIEGFIVGEDFDIQRNRLIEVIESSGRRELIHPAYGTLEVRIKPSTFTHSKREGRMVRFTLECVEAGEAFFPTSVSNNTDTIDNLVDTITIDAINDFFDKFSVDNVQSFVEAKAKEIFGDVIEKARPILDIVGLDQEGLASGNSIVDAIEKNLEELTTDYTQMVDDIKGLFDLFGDGDNQRAASVSQQAFFSYSEDFPDPSGDTTGNNQIINNNAAQTEMIEIFALGTSSKAANRAAIIENSELTIVTDPAQVALQPDSDETGFDTIEDAIIARDAIGDSIDGITATTTDDVTFGNLETLRGELFLAVPGENNNLSNVVDVKISAPIPSLVMSHGVYGTAQLENDVVKLNNPGHPGFMPTADPLKVRLL